MHIYYNDQLTEEGFLQPVCQGFQVGYGVFETIFVTKGLPCFVDMHYQRLVKSCNKLGLKLELKEEQIYHQAIMLVEILKIQEGRLKLTCFRDTDRDSTLMTLSPYLLSEYDLQKGLSIGISSIKRNPHSPLSYMKSLNYLENILAKEEAKQQGYEEALLLNVYNKLCEGAVSNIFWIKDNCVYTPEISCGILAGITRRQVIEICRSLELRLTEGSYEQEELLQAEEVFITNSLMGIMPVGKVDNTSYNVSVYKITNKIYNEFNKLVKSEIQKRGMSFGSSLS
jgi:4-amino-4-deoxychorismate lyase